MPSAAIVGLGRIGFGFSLDAKRRGVWTHAAAWRRSGAARLAGAVDVDPARRRAFAAAHCDATAYPSLAALLKSGVPEVLSVCTPTDTHLRFVRQAAEAGVKSILCEKPIAASTTEAAAMIRACRRQATVLAVNHTRRWEAAYVRARDIVRRGRMGRVRSVSARYPGEIFNVGTHLIDAIRMVSGLDPVTAIGRSPDPVAADPHVSGFLVLDSGAAAVLACHGAPRDLLFEIDVVGSAGRLRLIENGRKTTLELFRASPRYSGYREPRRAPLKPASGGDRFIAAVRDAAAAARDRRRRPSCTGEDGFAALAAAEALAASARDGGRPKAVRKLS